MKKRKIKISGIIMLAAGICAAYLIVTGKIGVINTIQDKKGNSDSVGNEKSETYSAEVPEGIIEDYKNKFNWLEKPMAETYDPDNKIPENGVYGYSIDENMWQQECIKKVEKYKKKVKVDSDKCMETDSYNKKSVHEMDEKIEITPYKCDITVTGMKIHNNFDGFSEKYFVDNTYEEYRGYLNGEGNVYEYVYDDNDNLITKMLDKEHAVFITFDIEVEAHSNWVQEMDIVPRLIRVKEDNDMLVVMPMGYSLNNECDFEINRPIYMDIGLYDMKDYGNMVISNVPMRKGESIKFTCGYLVPENIIKECMLTFNTAYYTDYYYDPFRVLIKTQDK